MNKLDKIIIDNIETEFPKLNEREIGKLSGRSIYCISIATGLKSHQCAENITKLKNRIENIIHEIENKKPRLISRIIERVKNFICRPHKLKTNKQLLELALQNLPTPRQTNSTDPSRLHDHHLTSTAAKAEDDPLFIAVCSLDEKNFEAVKNQWINLDWFHRLDTGTQKLFVKFLKHISENSIPRQNEVFRADLDRNNGYANIKKGIQYLFEKVQNNEELGESIVHLLNTAVNECPVSYLSCIKTAIDSTAIREKPLELIDLSAQSCLEAIHKLYAQRRSEIVNELAAHLGRRETHTPNAILGLIGKERNLPGYRMVIQDKQNDLKSVSKEVLLTYFDCSNTPEKLLNWMEKKLNGRTQQNKQGIPIYLLHQEVPFLIAHHLGIDMEKVREVVFDEEYLLTKDAIGAALEIAGILICNPGHKSFLEKINSFS